MEFLLGMGSLSVYVLITICTGVVTGVSLAAGFDLFKTIKEKTSKFLKSRKNTNYSNKLTNEMLAGATHD